jgi:hypothetical protein
VTYDAATADRAAALPGVHLRVLTGAGRHEADPEAVQDATELTGFGRGTAGMLLRANIQTGARRAAAAIVPVLIIGGLTASILGAGDTANAAASAGEHQQAAGAGFVVLPAGTPGLTTALLERIHSISGVEATAVTDTSMLAYQP